MPTKLPCLKASDDDLNHQPRKRSDLTAANPLRWWAHAPPTWTYVPYLIQATGPVELGKFKFKFIECANGKTSDTHEIPVDDPIFAIFDTPSIIPKTADLCGVLMMNVNSARRPAGMTEEAWNKLRTDANTFVDLDQGKWPRTAERDAIKNLVALNQQLAMLVAAHIPSSDRNALEAIENRVLEIDRLFQ
jgi:hypothetical protein